MNRHKLFAVAFISALGLSCVSCNKDDNSKSQDIKEKLEQATTQDERKEVVSELANTTLDALEEKKTDDKPVEMSISENIKGEDLKTISEEIDKRDNLEVVLDLSQTEITEVPAESFKNSSNITNVILPETVTEIGESAFSECSNIETVTLPPSVTEIKENAFQNCSSLQTVNIAETQITTVPAGAFSKCEKLSEITLPETVTEIGAAAFSECNSIEQVTLPTSVKEIKENAFQNCASLTKVDIAETQITKVPAGAFSKCEKLAEITLPETVTEIGAAAFTECNSVETVKLPAAVNQIKENAFKNCTSLKNITIGSKLSKDGPVANGKIGESSFENCKNLLSVILGSSITEIDENAFKDCDSLKLFETIALIQRIAANAFENTPITTLADGIPATYETAKNATNVEILAHVVSIPDSVFFRCPNIKYITFAADSKLKKIGDSAFYNTHITSISLPPTVKTLGKALFDSTLLTTIEIPAEVEKLSEGLFCYCYNLRSVTFAPGSKLDSLGGWPFTGVTMDEFVIPASVYYIQPWCFTEANIKRIIFEKGSPIKKWSLDNAFAIFGGKLCNVEELTLPEITEVWSRENTFNSKFLPNLKKIYLSGETSSYCFDNIDTSKVKFIVPKENVLYYLKRWDGKFYVEGNENTALSNKIKTFEIPSDWTEIPSEAFWGLDNLTSITFAPNCNITKIGSMAFRNTNLTTIEIPSSVTELCSNAFNGAKLTKVTFASGSKLRTIADSAFLDCASTLKSIELPASVRKIGFNCFYSWDDATINVKLRGYVDNWHHTNGYVMVNRLIISKFEESESWKGSCVLLIDDGPYQEICF